MIARTRCAAAEEPEHRRPSPARVPEAGCVPLVLFPRFPRPGDACCAGVFDLSSLPSGSISIDIQHSDDAAAGRCPRGLEGDN